MRATTQNCHKFGHPEFSLFPGEHLPPDLDWLLAWLEHEVAEGKRFLPGQSVQIGWSWLEVRPREDGTLALFEPDFSSMPVKFVDSVFNTLLHLLHQKFVAESLGLHEELDIPSLQQSVVICTDFGTSDGFIMSRVEPADHSSGWFCGCDNPNHDHQSADNLQLVSLYEAAVCMNPGIIEFLGLPPDTFVGVGGPIPYFSRGEQELAILKDSYLHQKYHSR